MKKMRKFFFTVVPSIVLFAPTIYADSVVKTFQTSQVKRLNLKNGSGDTIVVGRNLSEVKVNVERTKWNDKCKLQIGESSGSLNVEVHQESSNFSLFSSNECRANISITMPAVSDISIKSGSGDVSLADLTGSFDVKVGSGNLKVEKSNATKLYAHSGSGDIKVSGELSDVDVKVGSGDINLTYQKSPTAGSAVIKSGIGDATLHLPKESRIKVDFKAGSGRLSNELDNLQSAKYSISMKAGSGNLNVKKL